MGQVSQRNIIILILCLLLTAGLIYVKPESRPVKKQMLLREALKDLRTWKVYGLAELDAKLVEALELKDYVNQSHTNGPNRVFLYIGYYLTSAQVGAAHDPLVCFPGQGWVLSNKSTGKLALNPEAGAPISYSSMIAQRGNQKELLVYWFQSYDVANPDTFSQKLATWWGKMRNKGEDNAFVRISMALDGKSPEEGKEIIFGFVREFYPVFLSYIRQGNEEK